MSSRAESPSKVMEWLKWSVVMLLLVGMVGGNYYYAEFSLLARVLAILAASVVAIFVALTTVKGDAFNRLRKEAWVEVRKVVWPTRQETLQTTLIVMAVVFVVALILWGVDGLLGMGISWVIGAKG